MVVWGTPLNCSIYLISASEEGNRSGRNSHSRKNENELPESWGNLGGKRTASIHTQNLSTYTDINTGDTPILTHAHHVLNSPAEHTWTRQAHGTHIHLDSCTNSGDIHKDTLRNTRTDSQTCGKVHVQKHSTHRFSLSLFWLKIVFI